MTSWAEVVKFTACFDGVELSNSYGEPSLKIGTALLSRHRLWDNSIVLKGIDPDERDELMNREPGVFFLEKHYVGYDIVLARLAHADLHQIVPFIERTLRNLAPKRKIMAYDKRAHHQQ